ncbi:hypothetical protein A1OW_10350 [Enterovibrio norvegicus]|uniref:tyrosine-type recombinase/integrase n=1 Tax=Enterovibrio norvegicus TaxID=188144 RepID=UPI0002DD6B24|nr:site-specific integrase [Enterovibrio norvegicus]OEF50993.1 hypothetical protein A1OW_10350 [Enterovibrio norvegicus]
MTTPHIKLTDAAIKRQLSDEAVTELKGVGTPFILRPHKQKNGRERTASWFFVVNEGNKTQRHKIGTWPALSAKVVTDMTAALSAKHAMGDPVTVTEWHTVGQLLEWYRDRAVSDRSLSTPRKRDIKSSINRHLIPALGACRLDALTLETIDSAVVWPLQTHYTLGTVRQHFALLKRAFKQAKTLKKLVSDPLAGVVFSDFINAPIQPKPSNLKPADLAMVGDQVRTAKPFHKTLIMLMLAHATRIGETRQLRWEHIDIEAERLIIPAALTKTRTELVIPLTPWAFAWLEQHKLYQSMWGYRGPFLFPNPTKRGPIDTKTANEWVSAVSTGKWTAHDLRKVARTCWADMGIDYMVGECLLNHALSKLDQAYIHTHVENQKRTALTQWHTLLAKKICPEKNSEQTDTIPTCTEMNNHDKP